jgi:hypothetical protein
MRFNRNRSLQNGGGGASDFETKPPQICGGHVLVVKAPGYETPEANYIDERPNPGL